MKVCTVLPRAPSKRPINAERTLLSTGGEGSAPPGAALAGLSRAPPVPQPLPRARSRTGHGLLRSAGRSCHSIYPGCGLVAVQEEQQHEEGSRLVPLFAPHRGAGRLGSKEQHPASPRHRFSSRPPPPAPRGHPRGEAEPPRGAQPRGLAQGRFKK